MKLKSSIKWLYDTVRSPALRADVVAFLRKYSKNDRPVTHYACRGEQTKTIVAFLESLGFKADEDFRVLSSTFDPESNSIRFTSDAKISELVRDLSSCGCGRTLDTMYATVAHPDTGAIVSSCFSDTEGTYVIAPNPAPDHFVTRMLARSDEILETLAGVVDFESFAPNGRKCVSAAAKWSADRRNRRERPYLLPLPILEAYYRKYLVTSDEPLVFYASDHMAQATRLAREDERVPVAAFAQAPIPEVSDGPDNPVCGYFCNTVAELEGADLSNKAGVFAVCDAPMVFCGEGFEDVVSPARMAVERWDLWSYVQDIYTGCYGLEAGFPACGMRVALADESSAWCGHPFGPLARHNAERGGKTEEVMLAKYSVLLTDLEMSGTYGDLSNFVHRPSRAPRVVEADDGGRPDFTDRSLSKDETAWEWFLMTHDAHRVGTPHRDWFSSRFEPATDSVEAVRNFGMYRNWKGSANLARLSRPTSNADLRCRTDADGDRKWNPLSSFVDGALPLAIRLTVGGDNVPFADWGGENPELHGPNDIVAAVYSGIWTDLSPVVGEENPDGVFPSMREFVGFGGETPEGRRIDLTKWLGDEANSADGQVKFAQRTKGTPRYASLVVETNVNAREFFRLAGEGPDRGAARLRDRLAASFVSSVLLRNSDPYAGTDEALAETQARKTRNHDRMVRDCGPWYAASFQNPASCANGLPNEALSSVTVWYAEDSYGRLVIGFTVSGDTLTYGRLAYRWTNEMPLATAHVRAKTYSSGPDTVTIAKGSRGEFSSAVGYLRRALSPGCVTGDFDGATTAPAGGVIGPAHREPFGYVAVGTAPTREWFTGFGTVSVSDMVA